MIFCRDENAHPEIRNFVNFIAWARPGANILKGKCMKRKDKLSKLLNETGQYGPMMDLVIRCCVNHLLVCSYWKDTKAITTVVGGDLPKLLFKHFKNEELVETIQALMKKTKLLFDFEYCYRHQRNDLVHSQLTFLLQNPQNLVFESLNKYYVDGCQKFKWTSRKSIRLLPSFSCIEGYDEREQVFIYNADKIGSWEQADLIVMASQNDLNVILKQAEGTFHIEPVDFSNPATLSITDDVDNMFKSLRCVDEHHRHLAKCIIGDCEEYLGTVMCPRLYKLEMIILLQAFILKDKPIIDVFYTFKENVRVMREPDEFCYIMSNGFMALFYKLVFIVLIRKMEIGVDSSELWSEVKDDSDHSLPSNELFGEKVWEDSKQYFDQNDEPELVLLRLCKTARALGIYKDSYTSDDLDESSQEGECLEDDEIVEADCSFEHFVRSNTPQYKGCSKKGSKSNRRPGKYKARSVNVNAVATNSSTANYAQSESTSSEDRPLFNFNSGSGNNTKTSSLQPMNSYLNTQNVDPSRKTPRNASENRPFSNFNSGSGNNSNASSLNKQNFDPNRKTPPNASEDRTLFNFNPGSGNKANALSLQPMNSYLNRQNVDPNYAPQYEQNPFQDTPPGSDSNKSSRKGSKVATKKSGKNVRR